MTHQSTMPPLLVREKLATLGAKHLCDTELLTVFIGSGNKKNSCTQLAQELLKKFGDLRGILNTNLTTFTQISGLGTARYLQLQAAREICQRSHYISLKNKPLTDQRGIHQFVKRQLRDKRNEIFAALFLDIHNRLIAYEELFSGTLHTANIYLRPIIERVLSLNAATLIIAHNHPSGIANASEQDYELTNQLRRALELVDVRLADHLVVGDNEIFSIMRQAKWSCY